MANIVNVHAAKLIAGRLLEIGAIKLNPSKPFTWASGWKSPIYCDNRLSLSYPKVRTPIKQHLCDAIRARYDGTEAIAGVATAGIPQGTLVADQLGLPFLYVRSKPKGHGMENLIEGRVVPGQKAVVVEDLISTGGSSLKAVEALRKAGIDVLGLVAVFTYGFDIAEQRFREAGLDYVAISSYSEMLQEALERGDITEDQLDMLTQWRSQPDRWGT